MHEAQAKWHLGEIASSQTAVAEAISLAKELNDMHGLAVALWHAAVLAYYEGNLAEVERLASKSIERIRQSNPPSGEGVFLMHYGHDGNRRGWHSEAAKPPRDQTAGGGIRNQWAATE